MTQYRACQDALWDWFESREYFLSRLDDIFIGFQIDQRRLERYGSREHCRVSAVEEAIGRHARPFASSDACAVCRSERSATDRAHEDVGVCGRRGVPRRRAVLHRADDEQVGSHRPPTPQPRGTPVRSGSRRRARGPCRPWSRHRRRSTTKSVLRDTEPATLAPSASARAFASLRVMPSSVPVNTTVLPASGEVDAAAAAKSATATSRSRSPTASPIVRLGEEGDQVGGDRRADAVDVDQLAPGVGVRIGGRAHRILPAGERAVVPGQQARRRLADLADAERVDEPVERDGAPRLDRRQQVVDRLLAPARPLAQAIGVRRAAGRCRPALRIRPSARRPAMCFSPRPSMSKASRETKWFSRSTACAGQIRPPVQRRATSPGSRERSGCRTPGRCRGRR